MVLYSVLPSQEADNMGLLKMVLVFPAGKGEGQEAAALPAWGWAARRASAWVRVVILSFWQGFVMKRMFPVGLSAFSSWVCLWLLSFECWMLRNQPFRGNQRVAQGEQGWDLPWCEVSPSDIKYCTTYPWGLSGISVGWEAWLLAAIQLFIDSEQASVAVICDVEKRINVNHYYDFFFAVVMKILVKAKRKKGEIGYISRFWQESVVGTIVHVHCTWWYKAQRLRCRTCASNEINCPGT